MMRWIALFTAAALLPFLWCPEASLAQSGPTKTATTTATTAPSAEDLELAKYLFVLENLDVLEQWELLNLVSVLEVQSED